ncbi:MAG: D-sedoheptulose-7-phosphate isomerase [Acidimicrobiales bacterium]
MTDFLYPFIEGDEDDLDALLDDLATSVRDKASTSDRLRATTLGEAASHIDRTAAAIARRLVAGGQLFTFGNGGSSTDATTLATLFACPPYGRALPARALVEDSAVLTALGNDVGFSLVFSRQLIAHARPGDVAVGFSTSGNSEDLLVAFAEASRRDLLTVGFAGYDGGDMGRAGLDHCLVVGSDSVHRIQEVQAALAFAVWRGVQGKLATVDVDG